jgi:hypothetical protein
MADENEHDPEKHEFEVVVNAELHALRDAEVTFDEVVELAFPGGGANPDNIFRVDFEDAASKPHSGSLVKGGTVEVKKNGTEFSVIRSVRS